MQRLLMNEVKISAWLCCHWIIGMAYTGWQLVNVTAADKSSCQNTRIHWSHLRVVRKFCVRCRVNVKVIAVVFVERFLKFKRQQTA